MLFELTEEELMNWYKAKKNIITKDFDKKVKRTKNFEKYDQVMKKKLAALNKRYSILLKRKNIFYFIFYISYQIDYFIITRSEDYVE